jgi:hypothetical protein
MSRVSATLGELIPRSRANVPVRCGFIHGSCMFFRAQAFRGIDGMPKNIFMYGEEPIIGHRLERAGFEVWYNPLVSVLHEDDACADKRWVPHQKALRKRNGHVSAHAEIWPRPLSVTWNALMAARELSRYAGSVVVGAPTPERHLDFLKLHLAGIKRVKGAPAIQLDD